MKIRMLFLALLFTSSLYGQDTYKIELLSYGGLPNADSLSENIQVIYNTSFITGYSNALKNPVWAAYRFGNISGKYTEEEPKTPDWERPYSFKVDQRTLAKVRHEDYTGTGYEPWTYGAQLGCSGTVWSDGAAGNISYVQHHTAKG